MQKRHSSPDCDQGNQLCKMLVIDDDVAFGRLLAAIGSARGFRSEHFSSLMDLGYFARIKDFDVAILDFYLETVRGDEIATYVDTFFCDTPVIIISSENFHLKADYKWPNSVKEFLHKKVGPERIIDAAAKIVARNVLLKRFSRRTENKAEESVNP